MKVGIFYGTTMGNTQSAAQQIQAALGTDVAELFDVAGATMGEVEKFSNLIFGASTWGIGDIQEDFEMFLPQLASADLTGKKVALFGLGDMVTYDDSFVDAMGDIYEALVNTGCEFIGQTPTDDYAYTKSRAEIDGHFVGLPLDEVNESHLTESRIAAWVAQLKEQFNQV